MTDTAYLPDAAMLDDFVAFVGGRKWAERLAEVKAAATHGPRMGRAALQRHAIELTIDRLRRRPNRPPSIAERCVAQLAAEATEVAASVTPAGRDRLRTRLHAALSGTHTLLPLFHLLRTGRMQRNRGFEVEHAGLQDAAPFDLLLTREGSEAEVACDVISAEDGRGVHRGAWFDLADRVDPDLQTWLAAHPGRYLLKLTLPQGLQVDNRAALASLHDRIRALLQSSRRADQDEAVVLRLDPLMLAAAQADELGLVSSLRRQFGPEAHLSVTAAGDAIFVMAARAGQENEIAAAIRRRLGVIAPARLTGTRPGILAVFIEDTDKTEWRGLRDRLELEGHTRQFLTDIAARPVVAVTCASRLELFGMTAPDAAAEGELRFRNPAHPAAKTAALAPAVSSSV